jgi:PBP4 family serine-type D-alanyl-D-alanine carboxypeptidase
MGIKIVALQSGQILYALNSQKLLMPASNNKLYTCAAALEKLGSDYRFKTFLFRYGNNLILKGGGDPDLTINQLDSLARITVKKINLVDTLFVDESFLDSLHYGQGWMWDEGAWWYAAPISALSLNDNCIDFFVDPGKPGEPAKVTIHPETDYVQFVNQSTTVNDTVDFIKFKIDRNWAGRTNIFTITGEILDTAKTDTFYRNLHDAASFSGIIFSELLEVHGITVKNILPGEGFINLDTLAVNISDSLLLSAYNLMHESDNLTAELFVKTMAVNDTTNGNWIDGLKTIKSFLADSADMDTSLLRLADGSGVSRYTLTSADQIIELLTYMYGSSHKDDFLYTLPGGGSNSTLKNRFQKSGQKIKAKTGHLAGASNLSGYIFSEKYGPVAFSILMNGYIGAAAPFRKLQDKIVATILYD